MEQPGGEDENGDSDEAYEEAHRDELKKIATSMRTIKKTKVWKRTNKSEEFDVFIVFPSFHRSFIIGTDADYAMWTCTFECISVYSTT